MVVDTSVLCSIIFREPSREKFLNTLASSQSKVISSVTVLELKSVVMGRLGVQAVPTVDEYLTALGILEVLFDPVQGRLAAEAAARFGKGRHPAGLNLGDCASYALARQRDEELLFQGEDFNKTDVRMVSE